MGPERPFARSSGILCRIILPVLLLLTAEGAIAQQGKGIRLNIDEFDEAELDSLDIADRLFEWGNSASGSNAALLQAIPIYEDLLDRHPEDLYLLYKCGISHLKTNGHFQRAIDLLSRVRERRPNMVEVKASLAEAYHQGKEFDRSSALLDSLEDEKLTKVWKEKVSELRKDLKNAQQFYGDPRDVAIRNIGGPINTQASEYVPVISSDESIMIFTYRGENSVGGRQDWDGEKSEYGVYYEDIYMSRKDEKGNWQEPEPIDTLNGPGHDANIALSPDGQKLFVYHNDPKSSGDIYVSHLEGDQWTEAEKLEGEVNRDDSWEGSVSLSSDGQTLYFSSTRDGGFGGKDLYKAELMEDSTWGNVQNMGPRVNTEKDDDAPFIHPENTALFFSSKGHNSMGGYDIFRTDLENGEWSEPINLGAPVNTPNDDIYYVISADGKRGYYSSGKPGGKGRQDIYVVEPGYIHDDPTLVLYKGKVKFCDEPIEANIKVLKEHDGKEMAYYTSNSSSGKFLLNLPSGKSYDIRFKLEDKKVDPIEKNVNAIEIDSFVQIEDQVHFYTEECRPDSLKEVDMPERDSAQKDTGKKVVLKLEKRKVGGVDTSTSVDMEYEEIVEQYGDMSAEGLEFKIQVAAYRHPENYDYSHVTNLGKVINDGDISTDVY
jgi:tetratricopeptide (TPR) repeat protein